MSQDRDLVEEERQARLAASAEDRPRASGGQRGMDSGTKKLAIVAGGLGGVLVLMVGGWSLLGHRQGGIPILSPPAGPVRVKPLDPGGMQLMAPQVSTGGDTGTQSLAPGPEEAAPQALQAEVDRARQADRPAPVPAPAPAPPAPAAGTPVVPAPVPPPPVPPTAAPAAPVAPPLPAPDADDTPAPANAPATADSTAKPVAGGRYAVQLAALDSEAAARGEWARLLHRAPSLFAGHTPTVAGTTRNGKQFFRLRTGGFSSIAAATGFCQQLKQSGIACTLADF